MLVKNLIIGFLCLSIAIFGLVGCGSLASAFLPREGAIPQTVMVEPALTPRAKVATTAGTFVLMDAALSDRYPLDCGTAQDCYTARPGYKILVVRFEKLDVEDTSGKPSAGDTGMGALGQLRVTDEKGVTTQPGIFGWSLPESGSATYFAAFGVDASALSFQLLGSGTEPIALGLSGS